MVQLKKIKGLLKESDSEAVTELEKIRGFLLQNEKYKEVVSFIESYDFDTALSLLEKWGI